MVGGGPMVCSTGVGVETDRYDQLPVEQYIPAGKETESISSVRSRSATEFMLTNMVLS